MDFVHFERTGERTGVGQAANSANILEKLEHRLHPVSAFAIVPFFALANAGVSFAGGVLGDAVQSRLAWAIGASTL